MSIDSLSGETETTIEQRPRTGSTTFITTSGGLLTEELVNKLRQRQCGESAVRPETFTLPGAETPQEADIEDEMGETWNTLRERWDELTMDNELFGMDVSDARNKWILRLFRELDFEPVFQRENLEADGVEANLSHKGWPDGEIERYGEMGGRTAPILHTVEPEQKLDEKPEDAPRGAKSPHDMLQEFLNASHDHDWAVVTNGLTLRILRDYYHTYTRGYVEFDLENLFTSRNYGDFRALYRLCHATRFIEPVVTDEDDVETPLEQLYQVALATGIKVGQDLQQNVVNAIEELGNGFLNEDIRSEIRNNGQDAAQNYYQDILYVIYRLLFLLYAEQRGMMDFRGSLYAEEYSVTKLRERTEQRDVDDRNTDLWEGLKATFRLVGTGVKDPDADLQTPAYNGELFDNSNLEFILDSNCPNHNLLRAVDYLTHIEQEGYRQRISYADLGVEEIGAVYESLLEFEPKITDIALEIDERKISPDSFYLDDRGTERKETGSFYTDPGLVNELIKSALKPVVEDRVDEKASTETQEEQLLSVTVCDPACGSGAFLIAANNYLAKRLAEIRTDTKYPSEQSTRTARRDVVQHCIYGVDLNPMAVELAKVSLWINSAVENKPLNFLDHRIKCGNSLIGTNSELVGGKFPVDAYETSGGRDWHEGNEVRKRVRKENKDRAKGAGSSSLNQWVDTREEVASLAQEIEEISEDSTSGVEEKKDRYENLRNSDAFQREKLIYDVWTAAFYWPMDGSAGEYPSPQTIEKLKRNPEPSESSLVDLKERGRKLAEEERFFHWELEFSEIFHGDSQGFDVSLGNPPWEVLDLKEEEFFKSKAPKIANASSKSERTELINKLETEDPRLYKEFQEALYRSTCRTSFIKKSGRYELTNEGHINTYAPFSELVLNNLDQQGRAGIISPLGLATDSNTQEFFHHLVKYKQLKSLFGFENNNRIFTDLHGQFKFGLFTFGGKECNFPKFNCAFFLTQIEQIRDDNLFNLSYEDLKRINPETYTCPIFNSKEDADLTKRIYEKISALKRINHENGNPWNIEFKRMFDMWDNEGIFKTRQQLLDIGAELNDNVFEENGELYLPLYEAKFIHQFDHRFATFQDVARDEIENNNARILEREEKNDPTKYIVPRYWILESEYALKSNDNWHLGIRKITNATNEHTVISAIIPGTPVGYSMNLAKGLGADNSLLIISALNSYVVNYVARQKMSGTNLSQFIMRQLPIPSKSRYMDINLDGEPIIKRVQEISFKLIYTAQDLDQFAEDTKYSKKTTYKFDKSERNELRSELEALYFHIYDLDENDIKYIFDNFNQIKNNDMEAYGHYRTQDQILNKYHQLSKKITRMNY